MKIYLHKVNSYNQLGRTIKVCTAEKMYISKMLFFVECKVGGGVKCDVLPVKKIGDAISGANQMITGLFFSELNVSTPLH